MNDTPFDTVGDEPVEARIVAWVLGEASAFEAAELERLCEERPELLVFRRRMRALHGLLTEAEAAEPDHSWKLPAGKRKVLDEIFGEEKLVTLDPRKEFRIRRAGFRAFLAIAACLVLAVVVLQMIHPIWIRQKVVAPEKKVDFMPPSGGGGAYGAGVAYSGERSEADPQELQKAISDQEDKVEERRKDLATIVRTKGIIYQGQDSFYGQSGVVEDHGSIEGEEVAKQDTREEAIKRGLDSQDYVDAKREFESDQQLLQSMKLGQLNEAMASNPTVDSVASREMTSRPEMGKPMSAPSEAASLTLSREAGEPELAGKKDPARQLPMPSASPRSRAYALGADPLLELPESAPMDSLPAITATSAGSALGFGKESSALSGIGARGGSAGAATSSATPQGNDLFATGPSGPATSDLGADAPLPMSPAPAQPALNLSAPLGSDAAASVVAADSTPFGLRPDDRAPDRPSISKAKKVEAGVKPTGQGVDLAAEPRSEIDEVRGILSSLGDPSAEIAEAAIKLGQDRGSEPSATPSSARRGLERMKAATSDSYPAISNLSVPVDGLATPGEAMQLEDLGAAADTFAEPEGEIARPELQLELLQREQKSPFPAEYELPPVAPTLVDLIEEILASENPYSTFSLNISDASFQLAKAALAKGERPDPASIKPEQFYNAVDYGDPAPASNEPVAATIEQSAHPVIPGRNLVRVALRTGSVGRSAAQPLRLTLLVDQSGSMVREDRRAAMEHALTQLGGLLTKADLVTVIGFSRTPHLLAVDMTGDQAGKLGELVNQTASEGGTNLEEAMKLGAKKAAEYQIAGAQNRIVLFTDGAANLGDAKPERLAALVKSFRQQGLAFDIAGIGAEGLNDRLLSELARNGNGRYYVVGNEKNDSFARRLAGAFRPAAENVKVQVNFNPQRVGKYKLIGFEKDRLKTEDFRNDAVDAAELAAEEAGVAIYQVEPLVEGTGEIGEVSVRFRDTASQEMVERTWTIPYASQATAFDRATPSMQLAGLSLLAAEKLQGGPLADAIDFKQLTGPGASVKQFYGGSLRVSDMLRVIDALK